MATQRRAQPTPGCVLVHTHGHVVVVCIEVIEHNYYSYPVSRSGTMTAHVIICL